MLDFDTVKQWRLKLKRKTSKKNARSKNLSVEEIKSSGADKAASKKIEDPELAEKERKKLELSSVIHHAQECLDRMKQENTDKYDY